MRRLPILRGAATLLMILGLAACAAGPAVSPRILPGTGSASVPRIDLPLNLGGPIVAAAPRVATLESAASGDELAFVTRLLSDMQILSYRTGRETCGYVGRDQTGQMVATPIVTGQEASCMLPPFPPGMMPLASVHTHGTYSPAYESEFPTVQDMLTDRSDQIDGYIGTPGGRMWYVDTDTMIVRQLCGRGCLPQDPGYRPEDDGNVLQSYTLRSLQIREGAY